MSGTQRASSIETVPVRFDLITDASPFPALTDAIVKFNAVRDFDGWVFDFDPAALEFFNPASPTGLEIEKQTCLQIDATRQPGAYLFNWDLTTIDIITAKANGRDAYSLKCSLVGDIEIDTVDFANDELDIADHEFSDGDGPVQAETDGTLPTGISLLTDYWTIRTDGGTIQLATSRANALLGTAVTFSDAGTGTHTVTTQGPAGLLPLLELIIDPPDIVDAITARKLATNRLEVDFTAKELIQYDDDGTTVLQRWALTTNLGEDISTALGVQTKRGAPIL